MMLTYSWKHENNKYKKKILIILPKNYIHERKLWSKIPRPTGFNAVRTLTYTVYVPGDHTGVLESAGGSWNGTQFFDRGGIVRITLGGTTAYGLFFLYRQIVCKTRTQVEIVHKSHCRPTISICALWAIPIFFISPILYRNLLYAKQIA